MEEDILLEKIVVYNFKSYKAETEICFSKTNYTSLPYNVADSGILKSCMFVGGNASGKSNIIEAIKYLLDALFEDKNIHGKNWKCIFDQGESYRIIYYFYINGQHIKYSIKNNVYKKMLTEELCVDDVVMMDRTDTSAHSFIADKKGQDFNKDDVDGETLFLRTLYFNTKFTTNETLRMWMQYLMKSVYINAFEKTIKSYGNKNYSLLDFLNENGTSTINWFFKKYNFKQTIEVSDYSQGNHVGVAMINGEKQIFFKRDDVDDPVLFQYESLGNKNLLRMLPAFLDVVQNGGLLLIDEFSSGFHNELESLLIKLFNKESTDAQMIFVSHSTNLLTNSLLRPDQIYSVEWKGNEGSTVKRFSSEQPRTSQNMEKMYVSGIFGGLPQYEEV